jgi:PIN domain nuclease of toxin-antitoxin system
MLRQMILKIICNGIFNRLIISQGVIEKLSIVTNDDAFKKYKI